MSQYHDILRVSPSASQEEIKEAFRKRALECHPDRADEERREEAQEEFRRVREAFEILSDDRDRRTPHARHTRNASGEGDSDERTHRSRRSFKEEWRKYKNKRVHIGRDIVENVRGLSGEYEHIRRKNAIMIPVGALLGASLFLYNPVTFYGTGFFLFDILVSSLVGGVYGFAAGSLWAYADLFLKDYTEQ